MQLLNNLQYVSENRIIIKAILLQRHSENCNYTNCLCNTDRNDIIN